MAITRRKLLLIAGGLIIIGILVYSWFDPEQYVLFPKCPFKSLSGWDCPGCGSQRAIHSVLHGDFARAFAFNPLLILSIPYLVVAGYLEFFGGKWKHPRLRRILMGSTACIVIFIIVVLYWIGRNIL